MSREPDWIERPLKVGDRVKHRYGGVGSITAVRPRFAPDGKTEYLNWESGAEWRSDATENVEWTPLSWCEKLSSPIRSFPSGATRDTDQNKLDFEACLSPLALEAFAKYMVKHRGNPPRLDDNWQKGIPVESYMKSAWRHFFAVWRGHRGTGIGVEDLCALLFNVQGLLHELLKKEDGNR